jgi:sugar lactone lactonase YvrE
MKRPSRITLRATLGVVTVLAVLLVAVRLTSRGVRQAVDSATVTTRQASQQLPVVVRAAVDGPVDGIAVADDGVLWIAHHAGLSRVDPHTLRITATVAAQRPVTAVAAHAGAVWASA